MNSSAHYNMISEAWQYMLGANFHWGYFENESQTLEQATWNLVNQMLKGLIINQNTKVLDVGCGIGTSSFYIHQKFSCEVYGISNSSKGIQLAIEKNNSLNYNVHFLLRDATDNKFENNFFDIIWVLEMAHLVENKESLIQECYRVLKPNGQIAFCDLMFFQYIKPLQILQLKNELQLLDRVFGKAQIQTFTFYNKLFTNAQFHNIIIEDISPFVYPTLYKWKENAQKNKNIILKFIPEQNYHEFLLACDILDYFCKNNMLGYGLIKAIK